MPHPILRPVRRPRKSETALLSVLVLASAVLLTFWIRGGEKKSAVPAGEEMPSFRAPAAGGLFALRRLPHFSVDVAPEFLRALDRARPPVPVSCRKVRYKYVPARGAGLDGEALPGPYRLRYRGYCAPHWRHRQRSFKLRGPGGRSPYGYRTLNLNALAIDPYLFEPWAAQVLYRSGGIASRSALARLTLNGQYDGLRSLSENLDADLLAQQGLPEGALYREREHAALGRQYDSLAELKDFWQANTRQSGWQDLWALNAAIRGSVRDGSAEFRRRINVPHYINYSAVITITGTRHLGDHNIPVYRPGWEPRFIPVGYDFFENAMGELGGRFVAAQTPYMAMNWLSQLFWSDPGLRRQVHRRAAEILRRFPDLAGWYDDILKTAEPALSEDLPRGRALSHIGSVSTLADYRESNTVRRRLRMRVEFLRRAYLSPAARITPRWSGQREAQLAIEGAGAYSVLLAPERDVCRKGDMVRVRVHKGAWRTVIACAAGKPAAREFLAERNDIERPELSTPGGVLRNSIGAVLVDIENRSGMRLIRPVIRSLQTGADVPVSEDWPFDIRRLANGKAALGAPALPYREDLSAGDGYTWIAVPERQTPFSYDAAAHILTIDGGVAGSETFGSYGPLLCWRRDGRGFCYEFNRYYAAGDEPAAEPSPAADWRTLDAIGLARKIGLHKVAPGRWRVRRSAVLPAGLALEFAAGARLYFDPGVYLIVRGDVSFPATGEHVTFTAYDKEWGGLVLARDGGSVEVRNAHFSRANEFYHQGRRYTAALTIDGPAKARIAASAFTSNFGDDGLNVVGAEASVTGNIFLDNRDAMDFDRCKTMLWENIVARSADDGVDFGGGTAALWDNIVCGSGDKGISVGEGAEVRVSSSLVAGNNVGIGVKEDSRAVLRSVLLSGNRIGANVYKNPEASASAPPGVVAGAFLLHRNETDYQKDGVPEKPDGGASARPDDPVFRYLLFESKRRGRNICPGLP
ncbi:MAG: CotH kinase family protein [Elusimicrobiota bacterium]